MLPLLESMGGSAKWLHLSCLNSPVWDVLHCCCLIWMSLFSSDWSNWALPHMTLNLIWDQGVGFNLSFSWSWQRHRRTGSNGHTHLQPLIVMPANVPLAKACHVTMPNLKSSYPHCKVKWQRARVRGRMKNFLTQVKRNTVLTFCQTQEEKEVSREKDKLKAWPFTPLPFGPRCHCIIYVWKG